MRFKKAILYLLTSLLLLSLLTGCLNLPPEQETAIERFVQLTFISQCPDVGSEENVYIEFVDEVTGLALNPSRYQLELNDDHNYQITLPFRLGSFLKYRFIKGLAPIINETNAIGEPIAYRFYWVRGNNTIVDRVATWSEKEYNGPTGRLQGIAIDSNNEPISNALINIAGNQTVTGSDGKFFINAIIPGTHILSVFSVDGKYQPFQQEAIIEDGAVTPAIITLSETKWVNITFTVKSPENSAGLPLRIVGDMGILGNTFSDLYNGARVIASRAPIMSYQNDGSYTLTLSLPSGYDVGYRYTLGDGFWNADYKSDGNFQVRHLIIPEHDIKIEDVIETWSLPNRNHPISFTVAIPASTPVNDHISIQINEFGWSSPLPMWPLGNNQWYFILHNPPLDFTYRYCRNDICGIADNQTTAGDIQVGQLYPAGQNSTFDIIDAWQWWIPEDNNAIIKVADTITPKGNDFMAGVELLQGYNPVWMPQYAMAVNDIIDIGANWVIIPSIWTHQDINTNDVVIVPLTNTTELDAGDIISLSSNLKTALYPRSFNNNSGDFWNEFVVTDEWFTSWFDQYRHFLLANALFAQKSQVDALIIGEPFISPILSGETLIDGTKYLPDDGDELWRELISDIRSIYSGKLLFAIDYEEPHTINVPGWLGLFDQIYVNWNVPLAISGNGDTAQMVDVANNLMEMDIFPIYQQYQKPIVIAIGYASAVNAATGCISNNDQCINRQSLDQPQDIMARSVTADFQTQVDTYSVMLSVVNQKNWVNGFVTTGYFYPAILHDSSSSIHGKPSADLLWYWFPKLTLEQ